MIQTSQDKLRACLKEAVASGIVQRFALRRGGRATIYPANGNGKYYTISVLDTLAVLNRIKAESQA